MLQTQETEMQMKKQRKAVISANEIWKQIVMQDAIRLDRKTKIRFPNFL
jgi:hypothetical protein